MLLIKITIFLAILSSCEFCWGSDMRILRREYNTIMAKLDTLVRLNDLSPIESLMGKSPSAPADTKLLLIFWADDEAEVFLNGFLVGRTRLTPMQVEIPSIFLKQTNELKAHCWDTDKVESGFMAGLYVVGSRGGLHPLLLTDDNIWSTAEGFAEVRFYSNSVPDIPEAEVIWDTGMYGEVWFETQFSLSEIANAKRVNPVEKPFDIVKPMESHSLISTLISLNERKKELEEIFLTENKRHLTGIENYTGYVSRRLAFSLGSAGRLASKKGLDLAEKLDSWQKKIPQEHGLQLVIPSRDLKGSDFYVARQQVDVAFSNKKDRKKNYIPPKDFYDGKLNRPTKVITDSVIKDDINKSFFPLSLVFLFLSLYNLILSKRCWETWVEER